MADLDDLVDLAAAAATAAAHGRSPTPAELDRLPPALRDRRGAFVTLHVAGALNGCIGTMGGEGPLAHEVQRLAVDAALHDPRLPALGVDDLRSLEVEVSVLSPRSPIPCRGRAELVAALRPGIDGLVIASGPHRAVFLPDVWAQLPNPDAFLDHLLAKARLQPGTWPTDARAERFTTERASRRWRPTDDQP